MQWCTFKHEENSCEIEWKYDLWNVTMGPCDNYKNRVEFRVSITVTVTIIVTGLELIWTSRMKTTTTREAAMRAELQATRHNC